MKGVKRQYLDKGFVEVVDYMGDDTLLAMAARASFNEIEYSQDERNRGLINYLVEHTHTTPLEMGEIIFRIKMPIFVARQHMRHRTASINEQSLRYITHDGDYYIPSKTRVKYQNKNKKQGSGNSMPDHIANTVLELMTDTSDNCWKNYNLLINAGLANELARSILPVNFYTTLVWKMDLHNLLHYLLLRSDREHAQEEIVDLADLMLDTVKELFPMTHSAWVEFKKEAVTFSKTEKEILKKLVSGTLKLEDIEKDDFVILPKRRKEEFLRKIS